MLHIFLALMMASGFFSLSTSQSLFTNQLAYGNMYDRATDQLVPESVSPVYDRMIIGGDVMLARKVERLTATTRPDYPFQRLPEFGSSTLVLANFEAVVPEQHRPTPDFGFSFSVPTSSLPAVHEVGFTHLSLANNHSYDFADSGYNHTHAALKQAGMIPFGDQTESASSSITVVTVDGRRIALIALNAVNRIPKKASLEAIFSAAQETDYQFVYIHWGAEYQATPTAQQKLLAAQLVTAGADLVVGHHPHVVQSIEQIDDVPIIYSLGNFIFDQYFSDAVQEGLLVAVEFVADEGMIELLPITSLDLQSAPRVMNDAERAGFLTQLAEFSDPSLQTQIAAGTLSF